MNAGRQACCGLRSLLAANVAALLFGCATAPPAAQDSPERAPLDFYVEQVRSTAKLDRDATVRIVNHWGDIQLRSDERARSVIVDAAVQRIGHPFPDKPRFVITQKEGAFEMEVRYPGARREPRSGRVDLAVYLPPGYRVNLETLDGTIEARKTAVDLTARTDSGDVRFINQGAADVETKTGRITARPTAPGWGRMTLYSAGGKIVAFLPVGPGLEVVARGTPDVRSDWPLLRTGEGYLLRLGTDVRDRDEVLVTSGASIELLEVVLAPAADEPDARRKDKDPGRETQP